MADRARSTFPIAVEFVEGELPSATKMNGLSRQAKQSSNLIEFMLGDLWNQSGDSLLQSAGISENALMISNISRYLGSSKILNPRIPYLPDIEKYNHRASLSEIGGHNLLLEFPVKSGSSYLWSGTSAPVGNPEINKSDVDGSGKWYVDEDTGQVYTYDSVVADWDLTYEPVVDGDIDSLSTWNIIPDPDTDNSYSFKGIKIQYVNGVDNQQGYYIFLPPRGPLDTRRLNRSPQNDTNSPNNTKNFQTLPVVGDRLFWQDDTVDAVITTTEGEHYRYILPKIITDSPSWGKSVSLPQGLIYLWDPIYTGTIIEGIIFSAENAIVPRKYLFIAQGGNLDNWLGSFGSTDYPVSSLQNTSHASSFYPANGLRVITIGNNISQTISSLLSQYLNHDHSSSNSIPTRPVLHNKLTNLFDEDGESGSFSRLDPSSLSKDDHPQYLHRYGSTSGVAETRDKYKNAMLGDLLIGSIDSSSNHINTSNDSFKLKFNTLNNVSIFYDQSENSLRFNHPSSSDARLEFGVEGESTSRYRLQSSTTSTIIKTLQSGDSLQLQPAGKLFLDAAFNTVGATGIDIGTINGGPITVGNNLITNSITSKCYQEFKVAAGSSGLTPSEQPDGNGVRLYSQNRMDLAAGSSAPLITGQSNDDIFIRSGDDVYIKTGDDFIVESLGEVNIKGTNVILELKSNLVDDIIVTPKLGGFKAGGANPLGFGVITIGGNPPDGYGFGLNNGDLVYLLIDHWPELCTMNHISLWMQSSLALDSLDIRIYRYTFGSSTVSLMGSLIGTSLSSGFQTKTIVTGSSNTFMSHSLHAIQIVIQKNGSSAAVEIMPTVRLNITYSKLSIWPGNV